MDYFKKRKNVDVYTEMMAEYDNSFVLNEVYKILPKGSSLLEIGIGTGGDIISLSDSYDVVGSDSSPLFVEDFKKKSTIEAIVLDAVDIQINRSFDCIYSNKVLQHVSKEDFVISLKSQCNHLLPNGIIFATLWAGEYREEYMFDGELRFVYYDEASLKKLIPKELELEKLMLYSEFDPNDSLLLVLRKK